MKRISWLLIIPLALVAVSAPVACVESLNFEYKKPVAAGGSGGAGGESSSTTSTTSTSSTGGMGGMGGSPDCTKDADCDSEECRTATGCDEANGVCLWVNIGSGLKPSSQIYGDCNSRVCDGNGGITSEKNDLDLYEYGNPCVKPTCDASSMPVAVDAPTSCKTPWGNTAGTCSMTKCIECMDDPTCGPNKLCVDGQCLLDTCMNGTMDGAEKAMDCGGKDCLPCPDPAPCDGNSDCRGACNPMTMLCVPPSCGDMVRNADETDEDCGGSCANKCDTGKNCVVPIDCASGVCQVGTCQLPSCYDYVQNQGETGVDCGAPCDPPCPIVP